MTVAVRKHLDTNRKDKDSKFRLILVESRIHCLARYYKRSRPRSNTTVLLPRLWSRNCALTCSGVGGRVGDYCRVEKWSMMNNEGYMEDTVQLSCVSED